MVPDPGFFQKSGPIAVSTLVERLGCALSSGADPFFMVQDVAPLKIAGARDLSFLDNIKYKAEFTATKAGACFVTPEAAVLAPKGLVCLITRQPYKAYAQAAQMFYPESRPAPITAPSALIHTTAIMGKNCVIEPNVVIGAGAQIGDDCWLEAGCVIGENVRIGRASRIGVNATISHAVIGDYVRLYTGVRVGQDGFGFAIDPAGHVKVPQLGRVMIGNRVEIGANTCVDRGAGPDTIIGDGTWIDNLVQIAHNVVIGKGCVIAAQVGISGSTVIGDFVAMGGQVGIAGHLTIGSGARIAAQSGVVRDVPAGAEYMGYPAIPIKQFWRQIATLNALIKRKKSD